MDLPIGNIEQIKDDNFKDKNRSTNKVDLNLRINKIIDMITKGYMYKDIIYVVINEWGLSEHTAQNYLKESYKRIKNYTKPMIDEIGTDIVNKFNYLYQESIKEGDKRLANDILKNISKIFGLEQENIILKSDNTLNINIKRVDKEDKGIQAD